MVDICENDIQRVKKGTQRDIKILFGPIIQVYQPLNHILGSPLAATIHEYCMARCSWLHVK